MNHKFQLFSGRRYVFFSTLVLASLFFIPAHYTSAATFPATVDIVTATLDAGQNSLTGSGRGVRGCEDPCTPRVPWTFDATAYGWIELLDPPASIYVSPSDPRMGEQFYAQDSAYIWIYTRTVDVSSWPNGNYRFCVEVNGNITAGKVPGDPYGGTDVKCANFNITLHATPTPSPLPRIDLTKIQSTFSYPTNSDTLGVMNVGGSGPSGMAWTGSKTASWIASLTGGVSGGSGLLAGGTSLGGFSIDPTLANIGINNASIIETCSNCEGGFAGKTLGVQYTVPGPTISISAAPPGPVVAGTAVTLTWTGANCNASAPVSSSNFGASSCSGSTTVTPLVPSSTYTITVKGLSNVDGSAANFSTASVTVSATPSNNPPVSSGVTVNTNYCATGPNTAVINWNYSDPNNVPIGTDSQSAFQIQVDLQGSSFNPPEFDSGKIIGSQTSYTATTLPLGKTLKARVRVWDSKDLVSSWSSDSSSWKSATNAYPSVDFCWPENCDAPLPGLKSKANSPIPFTDRTTFYDGKTNHTWSWVFGDGGSSTLQNPVHTYGSSNVSYTITLTATDFNNNSCSASKLINVQRSIPIWREISPGK